MAPLATRASCKIAAQNQAQNATSPLPGHDIQSNPLPATGELTAQPRPKPRPKQIDRSQPQSALDVVDETQHQHPKRGRSGSDSNTEIAESSGTHQPPTKRSKKTDTTSLVKLGGTSAGSLRIRLIPPRSPLPMRINRVVNPGAPDQKKVRQTSAAVTAAMELKEKLKLELEKMEGDKIRMLAEMEAAEEEEQQQEERMAIRDVADLAEISYPNIEGELDKDTVMTTSEEDIEIADCAMVLVDELESPVTPVRMVSPKQMLKKIGRAHV